MSLPENLYDTTIKTKTTTNTTTELVQITYDVDNPNGMGINEDLDREIEDYMVSQGYEWMNSGSGFGVRDIEFRKKETTVGQQNDLVFRDGTSEPIVEVSKHLAFNQEFLIVKNLLRQIENAEENDGGDFYFKRQTCAKRKKTVFISVENQIIDNCLTMVDGWEPIGYDCNDIRAIIKKYGFEDRIKSIQKMVIRNNMKPNPKGSGR
tara:strand:- start:1759 stop:2379 length:621 start_codon:yes stop_codon:yes gene_type:complete